MSNRIIMRPGYSPVTKWHSVQVQRQCVMPGACHFIITSHWILPSSVSLSVCSSDSSAVPEGERSPQATWNVPSCALTQQIEKAGDFWQEQLNLHSPPAPHTRFSLFIFILFIFHFNTKQQLFMFYEGSINMQKKNLKLINRIIISCLSQNELLSYIYIEHIYIYIYILVSAKMGDVSSWRNNNNTQKALWQRRVLCFAPSTLFLLD